MGYIYGNISPVCRIFPLSPSLSCCGQNGLGKIILFIPNLTLLIKENEYNVSRTVMFLLKIGFETKKYHFILLALTVTEAILHLKFEKAIRNT